MTIQILDLKSERCPMALLKVKRFVTTVASDHVIDVYLQDRASLADIQRYLKQQQYSVTMMPSPDPVVVLRIQKEKKTLICSKC
ncbi:sulfurtransferase TusA family protein [Thaumasiovibrio sp. DFM-14]|uniref:sulfurtransferase TusA family protein n=1 Tax=Thaumasiovibrio sp. DFM-14 TaxID=3384792 RepID=UPI0039A1B3F5